RRYHLPPLLQLGVGTQIGEPEIRAELHRTKPEKNRVDQKVNNRSKIEPDRFGPVLDPVPCLQK
ncbi:unnamed protein product, partial [Prunus brigantina]